MMAMKRFPRDEEPETQGSGPRVAVGLLAAPDDLDEVGTHAWTRMCTAFLQGDRLRALHFATTVLHARPGNAIATIIAVDCGEWLERCAGIEDGIDIRDTIAPPDDDDVPFAEVDDDEDEDEPIVDLPALSERARRESGIVPKK
jgi:hypothetical protein